MVPIAVAPPSSFARGFEPPPPDPEPPEPERPTDAPTLPPPRSLERAPDEPLFPRGPNTRKLASLCALATLACERANRDATPSPFDGAAGLRLRDAFARPCRGRDALETLREVGLLDLFPHLDGLAQCGEKHQQHRKRRSPGWDYFDRVAAVDRLRSCAARLAADARDPTRAKYLAHQLALVYQCVNAARGESKARKNRI